MSDNSRNRASRRAVLKHMMGAAIVAATTGSFARKLTAMEKGEKFKLALKGGGALVLTFEGKNKWRGDVQAKGARGNTGLLLLESGKVVGLKKGYLRLGRFGAGDLGIDSSFEETIFTEFTQAGAVGGRDVLVANAIIPSQIEDLRNMRAISITPRVKLGSEQLRMIKK